MTEKLKSNSWYWHWDREGRGYIDGETELHEGTDTPSRNYCSLVLTDENGEIKKFRRHGEIFPWKKGGG